jgi:hypothetical protein
MGLSETGTRGAKSAGTLFFYNVFSDVLLNAEASVCGERVAAGQRQIGRCRRQQLHAKRTENAL